MKDDCMLIAEVKTRSPYGYEAKESWDELFELAVKVGDIVAIHTDPAWGGSWGMLWRACRMTDKPILAKGIHCTDRDLDMARERGATCILTVDWLPDVYDRHFCLCEPTSVDTVVKIRSELDVYPLMIVWNSRDLVDGMVKKETFDDALAAWQQTSNDRADKGLEPSPHPKFCQASNIHTVEGVHPEADAVLVGRYLYKFAEDMGRL